MVFSHGCLPVSLATEADVLSEVKEAFARPFPDQIAIVRRDLLTVQPHMDNLGLEEREGNAEKVRKIKSYL